MLGQHSYPGDFIAVTTDLEFETARAGEACASLPCGAACGLSVNAFGKETITVRVDTSDFWEQNSADPATLILVPSNVCMWCYEQMYNNEVETKATR